MIRAARTRPDSIRTAARIGVGQRIRMDVFMERGPSQREAGPVPALQRECDLSYSINPIDPYHNVHRSS
ncbi:Hypothetical protein GbCGDNIH9_8700 [Granulibacter bethesdensis]|uniref:Uncharacterized protein n=1 Tax=Granulibacter bethesdensis TaxID=364410 RepID=A0AAC9K8G3_9PROT|nr:Hypothetical protein GbCGDNIH9_8700 [Granulibacter bethesdensis]APH63251.1 Hypothetical protein GbCGDNIH8_8700 [Granulibacter bethesdensis]